MRVLSIAAFALTLTATAASASQASGAMALALAGLVADHGAHLTHADRRQVEALFAGNEHRPHPAGRNIVVKADKIQCRISDVEISARSCQVTISGHTRTFTGRPANELYATLATAGVPSDGAAGSIFEAVAGLTCTLTPSVIKQNGGGGASCDYTVGP